MTIKEFINLLNPESILNGKIYFKIIKQSGNGEKWFFWCDQEENPTSSIDDFCNHEGIKGCMNLQIYNDDVSIETITSEDDDNSLRFKIFCFDPKEER